MAFVFDKCCGCIELRTGCLIIGYINLIGEIIGIVFCALAIIGGGVVTAQGKDEDTQTVGAFIIAVAVIMLIFILLFFIFTIVLLVGLHKNKRGHIKAYMIFTVIFLALSIIGWLASFAGHNLVVLDIIKNLISILLSIYFLLVIRSYYLQMDDPSKRPAIYNTA